MDTLTSLLSKKRDSLPMPLPSPQSIEVPKVVERRESLPTALKKPKLKVAVSLDMNSPVEPKEKKSVTIDTGETKMPPMIDLEDTERGTKLPPINLKDKSPMKSPLKNSLKDSPAKERKLPEIKIKGRKKKNVQFDAD